MKRPARVIACLSALTISALVPWALMGPPPAAWSQDEAAAPDGEPASKRLARLESMLASALDRIAKLEAAIAELRDRPAPPAAEKPAERKRPPAAGAKRPEEKTPPSGAETPAREAKKKAAPTEEEQISAMLKRCERRMKSAERKLELQNKTGALEDLEELRRIATEARAIATTEFSRQGAELISDSAKVLEVRISVK